MFHNNVIRMIIKLNKQSLAKNNTKKSIIIVKTISFTLTMSYFNLIKRKFYLF
jgi:hypothetical protein